MDFWMPFFRTFAPFGHLGPIFCDFWVENDAQNNPKLLSPTPQGRPRPLQKRIRIATSILDGFWMDFGSNFGCFLESKKVENRSSENMKNLCFPIEKHRFLRFEGGCFGNKIDAKTESEIELVLGMIFG